MSGINPESFLQERFVSQQRKPFVRKAKVFTIHEICGGEQKNGVDLIFFSLKILAQEFR